MLGVGVNKVELVELLARRLGTSRADANRVLGLVVDTITAETAASGKVAITGFGVFEKVPRPVLGSPSLRATSYGSVPAPR
jgi:DNA-binding protein HU-beta